MVVCVLLVEDDVLIVCFVVLVLQELLGYVLGLLFVEFSVVGEFVVVWVVLVVGGWQFVISDLMLFDGFVEILFDEGVVLVLGVLFWVVYSVGMYEQNCYVLIFCGVVWLLCKLVLLVELFDIVVELFVVVMLIGVFLVVVGLFDLVQCYFGGDCQFYESFCVGCIECFIDDLVQGDVVIVWVDVLVLCCVVYGLKVVLELFGQFVLVDVVCVLEDVVVVLMLLLVDGWVCFVEGLVVMGVW